MALLPPFEEPAGSPELDELVRELDQRLDGHFLADLRPALDGLAASSPEAAPAVSEGPPGRDR